MKVIAIKIRIERRKRKKILKRLKMLNQVETGPANDKIVKNDGSCATFFFFFSIYYFGFKKKKKKKKGRTKLFKNMVWYFPDLMLLGKEGRGISFFFGPGIPQTLTKEIKIRKKKEKKKMKISYKQKFFLFFFFFSLF